MKKINSVFPLVLSQIFITGIVSGEEYKRQIEEVVVTSQKRDQDVMDVPISISVVNEQMIDEAGLTDANELSQVVPNLVINLTTTVGFVSMRGLGSGNNKGFERSVAMQVDGFYYGRQDYLFEAMADTKQIEVLRGPQGTLFGKNAIAGALNITTGKPSPDFTGKIALQGGEYNRQRARIAMGGPIIDDVVNARFSYDSDIMDGAVDNTTFDLDPDDYPNRKNVDENLRDRDFQIGRLKLNFPNIVENLDVNLSATKARIYGNSIGLQLTQAKDFTLDLYRRYDPETEDDKTDFRGSINEEETSLREGETFTAQFDYYLADYVVSALIGNSSFDKETIADGDFGPIDAIVLANDDSYEQNSVELRLVSPRGDFEYVAGLYYFENKVEGDGQVIISTTRALEMIGAARSSGLTGVLSTLSPAVDLLLSVADLDTMNNDRYFNQETESYAFFAQSTWHLLENLDLILGVRYSEEEKNAHQILSYENTPSEALYGVFLGEEAYNEFGRRKEYDFSPKISVRYDWSEEVSLYLTYATAFKAGGFNEQSVDDTNLTFEPENAKTYETGVKTRFYNGAATLNFGLFYTEFDNLQVSLFDGLNFSVGNAAKAISKGVEVDGQLIPVDWYALTASVAYLNARYTSYPEGQCPAERGDAATSESAFCDLGGRELTRSPEWEVSIGNLISLSQMSDWLGDLVPVDIGIGLFATYRAHQYLTTDLDPIDAMAGHTEVTAILSIKDLPESWSFNVSVKNLTDKVILQGASDVPLQPGSHSGVIAEPRRFFAELKYEW